MKTKEKNHKRILSVTIRRMLDSDPDTSHLGEYSDRMTSNEFSIDRAHDIDCSVNTREIPADKYAETHYADEDGASACINCDRMPDEWSKAPCEYADIECSCGRTGFNWNHREYRYFNPSFNYVKADGSLQDGNTEAEVRKYVAQDFERMEGLNNQQWCYVGLRAEAEVQLGASIGSNGKDGSPIYMTQTITSPGLWGVESDSDRDYFADIEKEELAELRGQLEAIGFSKRAVSAAFRDVERKDD